MLSCRYILLSFFIAANFFNLSAPSAAHALQQPVYYTVKLKDKEVGWGIIAAEKHGSNICVDYRFNVDVKRLGISVYSTYRFQRAVFDGAGSLIRASSKGEVKGETYNVSIAKENDGYIVTQNGKQSRFSNIKAATLTPIVVTKPKEGVWLDITTGKTTDYKVQIQKGDTVLFHENDKDTLIRKGGVIETFLTGSADSPIEIRKAAGAVPQGDEYKNPVPQLEECR